MPSHLRRYNEPGHIHFWTISCFRRLGFFHWEKMRDVVLSGLALLQSKFGVCLVGYVVMPEHVHVLIYPHQREIDEPTDISKLLSAFKQHVGFYGKQRLRDYWRKHRKLWSEPLNDWANGRFGEQPIWNVRGYDFNIDREGMLHEKLTYCHKNPVTRGLVEHPADWRWSSFRYYELSDASALKMDWDGRWPIVW